MQRQYRLVATLLASILLTTGCGVQPQPTSVITPSVEKTMVENKVTKPQKDNIHYYQVAGDSMSPTIAENSVVQANLSTNEFQDDDIVIARVRNNDLVIKRLKDDLLVSDNPSGQQIFTRDATILGKVIDSNVQQLPEGITPEPVYGASLDLSRYSKVKHGLSIPTSTLKDLRINNIDLSSVGMIVGSNTKSYLVNYSDYHTGSLTSVDSSSSKTWAMYVDTSGYHATYGASKVGRTWNVASAPTSMQDYVGTIIDMDTTRGYSYWATCSATKAGTMFTTGAGSTANANGFTFSKVAALASNYMFAACLNSDLVILYNFKAASPYVRNSVAFPYNVTGYVDAMRLNATYTAVIGYDASNIYISRFNNSTGALVSSTTWTGAALSSASNAFSIVLPGGDFMVVDGNQYYRVYSNALVLKESGNFNFDFTTYGASNYYNGQFIVYGGAIAEIDYPLNKVTELPPPELMYLPTGQTPSGYTRLNTINGFSAADSDLYVKQVDTNAAHFVRLVNYAPPTTVGDLIIN